MKKEMKFCELPEKVQGFLKRICIVKNWYAPEHIIHISWLHNEVDWTKATNDERLAYAEFMYPKGAVFKCFAEENRNDQIVLSEPWTDISNVFVRAKQENEITPRFIYLNNKWAELVSKPDESVESYVKQLEEKYFPEPLFKVGDAPEWTIDLIKQLPHGTRIRCASNEVDRGIWLGQDIEINNHGSISFETQTCSVYFYSSFEKKFAKILSLPESYLNPVKPEEEFEAGEMVEGSDNKSYWYEGKFISKFEGVFIVDTNKGVMKYKFLRKPNPDAHLKELADEVLKESKEVLLFREKCGGSYTEIGEHLLKSMLIEMGKKVQSKNE